MHFPKWNKQYCLKVSGNSSILCLCRSIWVFFKAVCASQARLKLTLQPAVTDLLLCLPPPAECRNYKNVPHTPSTPIPHPHPGARANLC